MISMDIHQVFIDFKKAFNRAWHAALWATTKKHNISTNLIQVIKKKKKKKPTKKRKKKRKTHTKKPNQPTSQQTNKKTTPL